jgi:hypothetical protein
MKRWICEMTASKDFSLFDMGVGKTLLQLARVTRGGQELWVYGNGRPFRTPGPFHIPTVQNKSPSLTFLGAVESNDV